MNLRRYALFLMVAVLTFVIGVSTALLFGKVNPFSHRQYSRKKSCARLTALPDHRSKMMIYTIYRKDGALLKSYEVEKTGALERLGETTDETAPAREIKEAARPSK